MTDAEVWQFAVRRENLLRLAQNLLETTQSDAGTAEDAIRERVAAMQSELDAARAREQALRAVLVRIKADHDGSLNMEDCGCGICEDVRAALTEGEDK